MLCQGIPGAGKTVLASLVIDQLTTKFHGDKHTGIAYIYFDYRQREEHAETLLRNILKQLAQKRPSLPACVSTLYMQGIQGFPPSLETISQALQSMTEDFSNIFIILDALDECTASNDCRMRFLAEIFSFRDMTAANIFATSRPNTEIADKFRGGMFMEICAREGDIRQYLKGNIHLLSHLVQNDVEMKSEIEQAIISSVHGM